MLHTEQLHYLFFYVDLSLTDRHRLPRNGPNGLNDLVNNVFGCLLNRRQLEVFALLFYSYDSKSN